MRTERPRDGGGDPPSGPPDPIVVLLEITSPSDGAQVTGPSNGVTVAVTGTARVRSGVGAVEAVEISFADGAFQGVTADSPGFATWSASQTITQGGRITVTVRARHTSGLVRQAQITVDAVLTTAPPVEDTTPPTVAITSPLRADALVADQNGQAALTISGTAADTGGSNLADVTVSVDGVPGAVTRLGDDWSQWKADLSLSGLGPHAITARAVDGAGLSMETSLAAQVVTTPPKPPLAERLMLVEKYQLATYLGANGPGKIVKVISLLPGQKTTITSKTYKRTEATASQASSMLDSYTSESQSDFEDTLTREQSNKQTRDESSKWSIEGSASASWGFGSAELKAGASAGTNAAREEMAKNVANAVEKHAAKASSKRDIDVKTSQEDKTETGSESSTQDVIENINVSRTLNFVLRQAEQEFLSFLLLTDIRVGYVRLDVPDGSLYTLSLRGSQGDTFVLGVRDKTTAALPMDATASEIEAALQALGTEVVGIVEVTPGAPGSCSIEFDRPDIGLSVTVTDGTEGDGQHAGADLRRQTSRASYQEVTLSQLNGLLERVIVPDRVHEVRDEIVSVLSNVFDYQDEPHTMVEERALTGPDGAPMPNGTYLRVPKNRTSTYTDTATGLELVVPGVILSVMRNVMCADGLFCDVALGTGEALDAYSQGLQDVTVAGKHVDNDARQFEIDRDRAALALVQAGDADKVGLYRKAFVAPKVNELALTPVGTAATNGDTGGADNG